MIDQLMLFYQPSVTQFRLLIIYSLNDINLNWYVITIMKLTLTLSLTLTCSNGTINLILNLNRIIKSYTDYDIIALTLTA